MLMCDVYAVIFLHTIESKESVESFFSEYSK